jgi:hypothetical protein
MSLATIPFNKSVALSLIPTMVSVLPCRVAAGFPSPAEDHAVQRVEQRQWRMKQDRRTPGYTTDWDSLALVRA